MPGSIKLLGGIALLVSGLTGPSIPVIPQLFQQAGWVTPIMAFVLITFLAGSAALFLVESMASIVSNENFQASIEYSTLAGLFLGVRWHWAFQIILYIALQSQTVTSLIESFQSMDALLVTIAHKSCAISFQKGWECVSTIPADGLGVFSGYIFISFGYLITFVLVLPLGLIQLNDNIKFQIASFITLVVITIIWIATFFQVGITNNPIPAVGSDQGTVVGYVISNFAFVTTIPAFVNNIHPSTNIHRVVWISLIISCAIYIIVGLAGAGAFNTPPNSTLLAVISQRRPSLIALISIYVFPVAVLITSIPVFMIIVRYNLLRGNICSKPWAIFWSSILPWIIVIPFQTSGWLTIIMNWTSLIFTSSANLIIPFMLYLVSKRYRASAVLGLNQKHDEFQLRSLGTPSLEAPPESIPYQPRSPLHVRSSPTGENSPTSKSNANAYFDPEMPLSTAPTSDSIIRLIRSPSIHRNYGETAEGSRPPRAHRRPVSKVATTPALTVEGIEDEKTPLSARTSLAVLDRSTSPTSPTARHDSNAAVNDLEISAHLPAPGINRTVPKILIDAATITRRPSGEYSLSAAGDAEQGPLSTPSRTPVSALRSSIESYRAWAASRLPSPQEERDDQPPTPTTSDPEGEGGGGVSPLDSFNRMPDSMSSLTTSDGEIRSRTFEAFPRKRWFNSTKVAIVSCVLTTIMVIATIVYNAVLAAHGGNASS